MSYTSKNYKYKDIREELKLPISERMLEKISRVSTRGLWSNDKKALEYIKEICSELENQDKKKEKGKVGFEIVFTCICKQIYGRTK